ncbi:MAG: trypsin-like peptidase domain-containing protein [Hyphomicrobiaceae bacterium]
MTPIRVLVWFACASLLGAPSAVARDPHPGIIGRDDRQSVIDGGAPWDAVGQVNVALYRTRRQCTGTLVAPDVVVTAAHCVIDARTRAPFPLHAIHFVAGVSGGTHKGHSTARCLRFPYAVTPHPAAAAGAETAGRATAMAALARDVVAVVLAHRLPLPPSPLARDGIAKAGLALTHAAYPADRRQVLLAHHGCRLLQTDRTGRLWLNDCDTHPASSGGPLFADDGGTLKVAAIMLGSRARVANVALPVSQWRGLVENATCP